MHINGGWWNKKAKDKHVNRRQGDASVIQDTLLEQEDDFNGDVELEDVVK